MLHRNTKLIKNIKLYIYQVNKISKKLIKCKKIPSDASRPQCSGRGDVHLSMKIPARKVKTSMFWFPLPFNHSWFRR